MTDTRDDLAISSREAHVRRHRESAPRDAFSEISKYIQLCTQCGWDEDAHVDEAHEIALQIDEERRRDRS